MNCTEYTIQSITRLARLEARGKGRYRNHTIRIVNDGRADHVSLIISYADRQTEATQTLSIAL